jgi:hypothetical protein
MRRRLATSVAVLVLSTIAFFGLRRCVEERPIPGWPPGAARLPRGVFHVHSSASHDSPLTLPEIATAAATLGLDFVVISDHNQALAGPIELEGVTVLSAAELSTPLGHLIQLDGEDVPATGDEGVSPVGRVRAAGGWPVIAHPSDPKRPWEGSFVTAGGIEIANFASSARRRGGRVFLGLVPALTVLPFRPQLSLLQAYDRDTEALARWDGEWDPRTVGICGADAHGRIDLVHNLLVWQLVLEDELPPPPERAAAVARLLREGRFHCVAALLGVPRFSFHGVRPDGSLVWPSDTVAVREVERLVVESATPRRVSPSGEVRSVVRGPVATVELLRNGEPIVRTRGEMLHYTHPGPGTYRVEIRVPLPGVLIGERHVTVIYSNRIRITREKGPPEPG